MLEGEAMVDLRDPDSIISEIQDIMSDPNYIPITGPISLINALENAKKIRVNRGTVPIDGSIPTFKYRPGSGGSRGARGDEEIDAMIMEIANNDDIVLTPEMVELINGSVNLLSNTFERDFVHIFLPPLPIVHHQCPGLVILSGRIKC